MVEDTEKRPIESLPVVRTVCFHEGNVTHKGDYRVNLTVTVSGDLQTPESSYGDCDAQQVGSIHMSRRYPTLIDYLRDLGKRIQRDHDPTCVDTVEKS